MSYPISRSMNRDLNEGLSDGTYRKVVTNRGGVAEGTTTTARRDLDAEHYGPIHTEAPTKVAPDGLHH